MPQLVQPSLLGRFAQIVGSKGVLHEQEELLVYECDSLTFEKHIPQAIVFPQSAEQVASIVRLCIDEKVPYVARGAGTGISGGASAVHGGIIVHLSKMCRILELDPENRYAVVEPGLVNSDLSRAAEPHGLHFAPDPSSQTVCTIGGNVAENAGGPHCFKYGTTIDHVVALEVVTPTGEIIHLGGRETGVPGFDLVAVQVGAEGTLGIATKIGVRLTPVPEGINTLLVTFPSLETAAEAVTEIVASSIIPSALEMMDQKTIQVIESSIYRAGFPTDAAAVLLLELDGFKPGVVADSVTVTKLCEKHGALSVVAGKDEEHRKKLWAARKCTFGVLGRVNTDLYVLDGTVPRSQLPAALRRVQEIGDKHGLEFTSVFHAGDGNLHPLVAYDGRNEEETERVFAAGEEIIKACLDLGGTLSGEHGIGLEKKRFMPLLFNEDDLSAMLAVKDAFDPDRLCNPGKIFPDPKDTEGSDPGAAAPLPDLNGTGTAELTRAMAAICGEDAVEKSSELGAFAIDGIVPKVVVSPSTAEQVSNVLRLATAHGLKVTPFGGGTHQHFGNEIYALDVVVRTTKLNQMSSYEPKDQVVTAQAGTTITQVKEAILSHLQWIPLNPPSVPGATLGGLIATDIPNAARDCSGTLRDLVLGAKIALADGRIIKSGGQVLKNVSGYDLHRLMVGSLGSLGIILEVSLRVQSLPPAMRSMLTSFKTLDLALKFCQDVRANHFIPSAMELTNEAARTNMGIRLSENLQGGEFAISARFGETEQAVTWQILQASGMASERECVGLRVSEGALESQLWERMIRYNGQDDKVRLRLGTKFTNLGKVARKILDDPVWPKAPALSLRPMSGEILVEFESTAETIRTVDAMKRIAEDERTMFVIERIPRSIKGKVDCLGSPGETLGLMRRVKNAFDPNHTLNSGRSAARI